LKKTIFTAVLSAVLAVGLMPLVASADIPAVPPVYPGAVTADRPAGVALKAPPPSAKTYVTSDSFATVKAWYQAHLNGAAEMQQPGMEKTEDAFLVGPPDAGMVVMVQSYQGKTWIVIGPPM
jgi:hypothetical protein